MIAVISPAKSLNFNKTSYRTSATQPRLMECTQELIHVLQKKSIDEIKELMSLSNQLVRLNVNRYKEFVADHTEENSKPAILAFNGDVYQGFQGPTTCHSELDSESHLVKS